MRNQKRGKRITSDAELEHRRFLKRIRLSSISTKYWHQRYNLFSLYDNGIWLNEESFYSVTPEAVARNIAEHVQRKIKANVIIDAFCGAGGNSIQFAKLFSKVIAIDVNEETLKCARHNAEIYGVSHKIEFIHGDYFQLIDTLQADFVFLSPPWGGPEYKRQSVFDLSAMEPYNYEEIMRASLSITKNIALYVPRNSDLGQLEDCFDYKEYQPYSNGSPYKCALKFLALRGHFVALCAYYGDLAG
ncbi:RNA cap guanine-N2 methyltransferase-domain-containing protein [Lipomyces japonicus]|uniref:RNA cap guanine-N2 methyltransferase-domain-containing protein n=1 Tax=Lipomyces japonicus TaxID=56871 RepID=UPI0034CD24B7